MDGHVNWSRSETVGYVCPVYLDFESSFGADDPGGGFQGSADAEVCGRGFARPSLHVPKGGGECAMRKFLESWGGAVAVTGGAWWIASEIGEVRAAT